MKYIVTITKTDTVSVEIDAQSAEEAEEEAGMMLDEGTISFDPAFWPDCLEYRTEAVK